ncbi:MAG: hypothetical protein MI755_01570 [Sphingomonadales bacterium]|nr:hypothetical protein [Sphingomonadales bacterium]
MTPEDLPQALADAIAARRAADTNAVTLEDIDARLAENEMSRQWHRTDCLEHALSVFDATTPAMALTQMLIAMRTLRHFHEMDLTAAQRDDTYFLGLNCLASSHRFIVSSTSAALPVDLTSFYMPRFMKR